MATKRIAREWRAVSRRDALRKVRRFTIAYALLIVGAVFSLLPLYWLLITSLRPTGAEFTYPPQWIPNRFEFGNYAHVLQRAPFLRYTWNSSLVTVLATTGTLVSGSMAAYAFARLR